MAICTFFPFPAAEDHRVRYVNIQADLSLSHAAAFLAKTQ